MEPFPATVNADSELDFTAMPQPVRFTCPLPATFKAPPAEGSSAVMQLADGSLIKPAVADLVTEKAEAPRSFRNVAPTDRWMLTETAEFPAVRLTPGMLVGKLTVTLSSALLPNPFMRAKAQGIVWSVVEQEYGCAGVLTANGCAPVPLVPWAKLSAPACAAPSAAA